MPKYTCVKCGRIGHSKNIATRNFFPANKRAAILSNVFTVKSTRTEKNDGWKVEISATVCDHGLIGPPMPADTAEMVVADWIAHAEEQDRHEWLCDHVYVAEGEVEC